MHTVLTFNKRSYLCLPSDRGRKHNLQCTVQKLVPGRGKKSYKTGTPTTEIENANGMQSNQRKKKLKTVVAVKGGIQQLVQAGFNMFMCSVI